MLRRITAEPSETAMPTCHQPLHIASLDSAVQRLAEGLDRYHQDTSDLQVRDGLVHRFKVSYELSQKMLKRYLAMTSASPNEFDDMPFQDLIRVGNQAGLVRSDWPQWRIFREMRNKISHAYDETVSLQVVREISGFLLEAEFLTHQLRSRINP